MSAAVSRQLAADSCQQLFSTCSANLRVAQSPATLISPLSLFECVAAQRRPLAARPIQMAVCSCAEGKRPHQHILAASGSPVRSWAFAPAHTRTSPTAACRPTRSRKLRPCAILECDKSDIAARRGRAHASPVRSSKRQNWRSAARPRCAARQRTAKVHQSWRRGIRGEREGGARLNDSCWRVLVRGSKMGPRSGIPAPAAGGPNQR